MVTPSGAPLGLVLVSASYERVLGALQLATAALASGRPVTLLFSHGAVVRLRSGRTDELGEETAEWLRPRIQEALQAGTVPTISELLDGVLKLGGQVLVCPAAMALHNIARSELVAGVEEVCSLGEFLRKGSSEHATLLWV